MNKYYKTLELHKVLKMLADLAANEKTKQMALELEPCLPATMLPVIQGTPGAGLFITATIVVLSP